MTKRGGRPRLPIEQRPINVSVRLPPAVYDRYCREAIRMGSSVHALLKRALVRQLSRSQKTRAARQRVQPDNGSPTPGRG